MNVSPGVYSKITDLSNYVQAVPSTIGFICALAEQGRDNQLLFLGSRSELISEFGEPNITTYGKNYSQGLYCAYNFLGESGALYFIRCMPDDATFSNLKISAIDSTTALQISFVNSLENMTSVHSALETTAGVYPLCLLYPIGRGEYGNQISVRFTDYSNPLISGVYVMDIYQKQSDGTEVIVESFQVSFDPTAQSLTGDSLWITYILNTYSKLLRACTTKLDGSYPDGFTKLAKVFDKNIGTVSAVTTSGSASISDAKQDFSQWQKNPETGKANYMVIAKDGIGIQIHGWLGTVEPGTLNETVHVFNGPNLSTATRGWVGDIANFNTNSNITYEIRILNISVSSGFIGADPVPLKLGSDGELKNPDGSLNTATATQILAGGYAGVLNNPVTGENEDTVLDTENYYFSMVFDCGYPDEVKTQISTLVQTRRDCVALLDNGDNSTYTMAIDARTNVHTFNNYYCALYEEYNKVYDVFTGQDLWVSPIYHMSYLAPRNDNVAELWYAIAGYNRAAIDSIESLRFNPKLGQRDQMYLKQLNPIVKFSDGYVVWGQLTTQAKASALQDLNIVRLVLYVKKAFERFCRYFIFEQNDAITWSKVSSQMVLFLEEIKKRRGLYSYSVEVGASEYEKKTKKFHCNVRLNPTRVVEQINLNFFIE